jgi:hypothetical protein
MKILDNIYSKIEYPASLFGMIVGSWLGNVLNAVLVAFLTGAAAALGAHLLKVLVSKIKQRKNGKSTEK